MSRARVDAASRGDRPSGKTRGGGASGANLRDGSCLESLHLPPFCLTGAGRCRLLVKRISMIFRERARSPTVIMSNHPVTMILASAVRPREAHPDAGGVDLKAKLRNAGLRPTVQRLSLSRLLFGKGDRHVSAEALHAEAREAGLSMSLSTVYNTLNQFAGAGLLREIAVQGPRTYFHTRTSPHHHFMDESTGRMFDAADGSVEFSRLPAPPEGMEIVGCDVIIRIRPKKG